MVFVNVQTFANLTPLNLLLSVFLMLVCHEGEQKPLSILLSFVFVLGYLVELLGVHTGFPFGSYIYGSALGPRLFDIPLIIGLNWFLLVIGSGFLVTKFVLAKWLRVLLAAVLMVLVDIAIEAVAPNLNYWYWKDDVVPLMNYGGWFGVSLIMQVVFQNTVAGHTNKLAIPYLAVVAVFFILLNLAL